MSDEWSTDELIDMAQDCLDMGASALKIALEGPHVVIRSRRGVELGKGDSVPLAVINLIQNKNANAILAKDAQALFLAGVVALDPDAAAEAIVSVVDGDDDDDDDDDFDDEEEDDDPPARGGAVFEREDG